MNTKPFSVSFFKGIRGNRGKMGFSLIELIVVITIIAVITAIVTVNFGGINKKSRDGKRQADLERIRMALEVMRQVNGTYPVATGTSPSGISPEYLNGYPGGPLEDSYVYIRDATGYAYTLDAWMEVLPPTGSYGSCGTVRGAAVTCNYRVTQP